MAEFLIGAGILAFAAALEGSSNKGERLHAGHRLHQGEHLQHGPYHLVMQRDGNLVLYLGHGEGRPVWASNTYNRGMAPFHLRMQEDGNAVVYDAMERPLWASNTSGAGRGANLHLHADGFITITTPYGQEVWRTGPGMSGGAMPMPAPMPAPMPMPMPVPLPVVPTPMPMPMPAPMPYPGGMPGQGHHRGRHELFGGQRLSQGEHLASECGQYYLRMQYDGNIVLYRGPSENPACAMWASGTNGRGQGPFHVTLHEGDLILRDGFERPLWTSGTFGRGYGPHRLVVQRDGNVVIYCGSNQPIWATNTMQQMGFGAGAMY